MRQFLRLSLWLLAIYLVLCTSVACFLADVTLHPYRRAPPAGAEEDMRRVAVLLDSQLTDARSMLKMVCRSVPGLFSRSTGTEKLSFSSTG
jgi:hypothetical protein